MYGKYFPVHAAAGTEIEAFADAVQQNVDDIANLRENVRKLNYIKCIDTLKDHYAQEIESDINGGIGTCMNEISGRRA